jgi:excisionase family DNA binding protein
MEKVTLTPLEVSRMLGVSRGTIYTMVREEEIPYFKVRGKILFNRDVIMAWTRGEVEADGEVANA